MGLVARRLIQTIAKRNRCFKATDPARGRFVCIGKDMLGYAGPSLSVQAIDEENCGATFVITSDQQDRDGDVIRPRGLRLDSFKRSPVWFWNHQQEPIPIGTSWHPKTGQVMVQALDNQVIATCYFDPEDEFAMKIFGKIKRRMISACSIGFVPEKMDRLRDKANRDRMSQPAGYDVEEAELVEVSIVGLGSNRQALLVGRGFAQKRAEFGAKMKNRIRNLPTKKMTPKVLGNGKPISQTEVEKAEPENEQDRPEIGKSSAGDVQHIAMSKEKFPNQADAMSWADKQGLSTDDARETETDWEFHQFPETELVPDSGAYQELDDGIKAYAGQRVMEPSTDLKPREEKNADPETMATDDPPMDEEPLKPSAQALMDLIAHACEQVQTLEEPDILAFYQDMLEEAKKLADSVHPDLDLYEQDDPVDSDNSDVALESEVHEGMDEGDEMEESFQPYRHTRKLRTKGMSRKCMKCIKDAAEHLDDGAEIDMADAKACRMYKSGCRYHAKELRSMLPDVNDGANMMDDEPADTGDGSTDGGKAYTVSLKDDLDLLTKAAGGYDRLSKQVLGR